MGVSSAGWCLEHTVKGQRNKNMAWNNKDGNNLPHGNHSMHLSKRKVRGLKNKRLKERLFTVPGENKNNQGIKVLHFVLNPLITMM